MRTWCIKVWAMGIRIYKLNKAGYTAISHVSMPSRASKRVFNFNCNKKNICSTKNPSLLCSFKLEYFEELLNVSFSTVANFPFVILLLSKSHFQNCLIANFQNPVKSSKWLLNKMYRFWEWMNITIYWMQGKEVNTKGWCG